MDKAAWSRLARFALLIPARVGEISTMRWGHVDLKAAVWEQSANVTKNGDPHPFPLPLCRVGASGGTTRGAGGARPGAGPATGFGWGQSAASQSVSTGACCCDVCAPPAG